MKIAIKEDENIDDIYIEIICPHVNEQVSSIISSLHAYNGKLSGTFEDKTFLVNVKEVFYIEAVEGKTFLYTAGKVLETPYRLFELEDKLHHAEFLRISKQMIVNFDKVLAIKPDFNARLQLILSNKEAVIVSRQYAPLVKKKIGLKI